MTRYTNTAEPAKTLRESEAHAQAKAKRKADEAARRASAAAAAAAVANRRQNAKDALEARDVLEAARSRAPQQPEPAERRSPLADYVHRIDLWAGNTHPTGIAALDAQFRAGAGAPDDTVGLLLGPPGALKTLTLVSISNAIAHSDRPTVFLACDERAAKVKARALQRLGCAPAGAVELPEEWCARLDPRLMIIDGIAKQERLGEILDIIADEGTVLVVDSIQALARLLYGSSDDRDLGKLMTRLKALNVPVWASSEVSRAAQGSRSTRSKLNAGKGSGSIEYSGTLVLSLAYSARASTLTITLLKNRDGTEHPIELHVDLDRQTLTAPDEIDHAVRVEDVWAEVRATLAEHGPQSLRGLAQRLARGHAAVKEALAAHPYEVHLVGKRWALRT